jgi:biopolymer transport protein ExbB
MVAFLTGGGVMMIPLGVCGIIATYIIFERLFYYRATARSDRALREDIPGFLGKRDWTGARNRCDQAGTPLSQVLKKVLDSRAMSEQAIQGVADVELGAVLNQVERFVPSLGTIAHVATLLGLLGTVLGNIKAFGLLGSGGALGDPALLAGAIAQALFTTAAGLGVSIPAVIFYQYYSTKVSRLVGEMESVASSLIFTITRGL